VDPSPLDTVVGVPPTPFLPDRRVDEAGFGRVLRRAIDGGLTALTIAGNTGEYGALAADEIRRLADVAGATLGDRATFLVGVGGDLATARALASSAAAAGAFGIMIHEPAGPFRTRAGWVRYHVDLAGAEPALAVVPYLRDPDVGVAELHALADAAPNVVAVKYAVADPVRFADLVTRGPRLLWICGLAESWAPFFWPAGATAFTSGLALIEPRISLDLLEDLRNGRVADAMRLWSLIRPFEALRSRDGGRANVAAIKEALAQRAGIGRTVRPPLSELSVEEQREVGRILATWDAAVPVSVR
jgi:4-hydroxy-tetrahydrodipicolinate synthase